MFSVAAAMLWVYTVQCKRDEIEFCHAWLLLRLELQKQPGNNLT